MEAERNPNTMRKGLGTGVALLCICTMLCGEVSAVTTYAAGTTDRGVMLDGDAVDGTGLVSDGTVSDTDMVWGGAADDAGIASGGTSDDANVVLDSAGIGANDAQSDVGDMGARLSMASAASAGNAATLTGLDATVETVLRADGASEEESDPPASDVSEPTETSDPGIGNTMDSETGDDGGVPPEADASLLTEENTDDSLEISSGGGYNGNR